MVDVKAVYSKEELEPALDRAIKRAQGYFLRTQYPEGFWWGELESNPTMEAEYLLLTHFLGVADQDRWAKLVRYILGKQRGDGSWGQYYGGPGDVSTSVECYFALKLAGVTPSSPAMQKARVFILSKGGVPKVRVFTKIWLALFGQWEWEGVPMLPPELMIMPTWFSINIYEFSSWARATVVPMTIIINRKPICPIPDGAGIDELYPKPRNQINYSIPRPTGLWGWRSFFYWTDRLLRAAEKWPWKPLRKRAVCKAEAWVLSHQEADGSWGGIQPPWVYSLIALKTLGYSTDHPVMKKGLEGFEGFAIEENETWRVQACTSPTWDTCLAMIGLMDSGLPADHQAIQKASRWLLKEQITTGGDWQVKNKKSPPGGWAFEFHNDIYPDTDDAAEVLIALHMARLSADDEVEKGKAIDLGVKWLLSMQSKNGGWASFDKDNTKAFIAKIPFADFGETIDPPSEDVTAHVLELLGRLGYTTRSAHVRKGIKYLLSQQEQDGPWFGRWGVNYIYGTGAVIPALHFLGEDMGRPHVERAVSWLLACQNPDGGWGESCASYSDSSLVGQGTSTASQTAWALLALLAAGEWQNPAFSQGVHYLIDTQREDGFWDEPQFTGAGFPGYGVGQRLHKPLTPSEPGFGEELPAGFMINYHLYRNYWPLMALGRYKRMVRGPASKDDIILIEESGK